MNLPNGVDIDNLIADLKKFSLEASKILLYYSKKLEDSNFKSKIINNTDLNQPVTVADLKINELIKKRIKEFYPNVCWDFLSEEDSKLEGKLFRAKYNWLWVLDPLDGTKDFIQGTGNYAMHLSLNFKNQPVLGVVLIPESNELWFANSSKTYCYGNRISEIKLDLKINKKLQELRLIKSKNHNNDFLLNLVKRINFKEIRTMGSVGCKIASILRGENDIYISYSNPKGSTPKDWDFAAPALILKSAGGSITNLYNEELVYNKEGFNQGGVIIASNNKFTHESICSEIKQIISEYNLLPN